VLLHGLYDTGPLLSVSLADSGTGSTAVQQLLGLAGPVAVTLVGARMIRRRARAALAADAAEAARLTHAR
jgi:hypothetical protein